MNGWTVWKDGLRERQKARTDAVERILATGSVPVGLADGVVERIEAATARRDEAMRRPEHVLEALGKDPRYALQWLALIAASQGEARAWSTLAEGVELGVFDEELGGVLEELASSCEREADAAERLTARVDSGA